MSNTYGHWRVGDDPPRRITLVNLLGPEWTWALTKVRMDCNRAFLLAGIPIEVAYAEAVPENGGVCRFVPTSVNDPDWNAVTALGRRQHEGEHEHINRCTVTVDVPGFAGQPEDSEARWRTLFHEFLHCLGLKHARGDAGDGSDTCIWSLREYGPPPAGWCPECPGPADLAVLVESYDHGHDSPP